jgi:hypothetical protein
VQPLFNTSRVYCAPKGTVERFAFERKFHTGLTGMQPGTPAFQPTAVIHLSDIHAAAVDR